MALTIAVLIVAGHTLIDILLMHSGSSHQEMSAVSNVILGVVAFVLLFKLFRYHERQRDQVLARLEVIDQMNHHIRNALQVIAFNARPVTRNDWEMAEIKQAVNRIHWSLREILPKLEPEFEAFEGSARDKQNTREDGEHKDDQV